MLSHGNKILFLILLSGCLHIVPANAQTYSGRRPPSQLSERQLTLLDNVNRQLFQHSDEDPFALLALILVESGFNPEAVSHTGDYGVMQVNCGIWRERLRRELRINNCEEAMMDIQTNLLAGIYILNRFRRYQRCRGSRVYACYNGGQNWRGRAESCEASCSDDACIRHCWRPARYSDSVRRHIRFLRRNYTERIESENTKVGSPQPDR